MTTHRRICGGDIVVIETDFWMKPIPTRNNDWQAVKDNYDGAPDAGWQPVGWGATEADAIADLVNQIEEHGA